MTHEGDPADSLHVVKAGRFVGRRTTHRGETAVLDLFVAGDVFGEVALMRADQRRIATVAAVESGETIAIHQRDLDRMRLEFPEVTETLFAIMADKVERYGRLLLEALYVPAELRAVRRLLELADLCADGSSVPVTQANLASMAGTSRATVNRVLRREEQREALELSRGQVRILDRAALERRAGQ